VSGGIWIIGEGIQDVGRSDAPFGSFDGDLPRLLWRISEVAGGPSPFGYQRIALSEFRRENAPGSGRRTRVGSPTRELYAVIAAVLEKLQPLA
jgi:hypothetical protein